jgi:hypothetical protein
LAVLDAIAGKKGAGLAKACGPNEKARNYRRQILQATSLEEAEAAADKLRALGQPFLNWAGKAERLSFDVPTLPRFVHERFSTQAIIEMLKGQRRDKQLTASDLFGDPGGERGGRGKGSGAKSGGERGREPNLDINFPDLAPDPFFFSARPLFLPDGTV